MLIEIHMIQNHSPANMNRDDLGAPKTCVFGGVTRARISSQCLKRSIRNPGNPDDVHNRGKSTFAEAMAARIGTRTKRFPGLVREQLQRQAELGIAEDQLIPESDWSAVVAACTVIAQKGEKKEQGENEKDDRRDKTRQLIFVGPRHAAEFVKKLAELRKSDQGGYEYFQDPRVVFTTLMEELLGTSLDEEQRKKAVKNGWLIVKYPHRWQALNEWARKQSRTTSDSEDQDSEDGGEESTTATPVSVNPGQVEAEFVAQTLSEMASRAERDQEAKELLDDLLKAKVQKNKKWRNQQAEGKIEDERKKPNNYSDFLDVLRRAAGPMAVDIALFGRMTTSGAFEDVEAAMQVAHAISTHAVVNEVDYWTAVDDMGKAGGGSGHLGEAQYSSACYYKYFCLDWDQLVSNLAGPEPDKENDAAAHNAHKKWKDEIEPQAKRLGACTLGHFIRAAAMTTPSGKQNSFASHTEPCGILVEIKKNGKHLTNYANAFAEPVERTGKWSDDGPDYVSLEGRSIARFGDHIFNLREAYGIDSTLLWHAMPLYRFPLQGWKREGDGRKKRDENGKELPPVPHVDWDIKPSGGEEKSKHRALPCLGGNGTGGSGLVEAVIEALEIKTKDENGTERNLTWRDVMNVGRTQPDGAAS